MLLLIAAIGAIVLAGRKKHEDAATSSASPPGVRPSAEGQAP
jgi:hypothetical protein